MAFVPGCSVVLSPEILDCPAPQPNQERARLWQVQGELSVFYPRAIPFRSKQRMINKGWYRLGWCSEAGSAQPSVYIDNLSRKSSGQRGRNTGSHSGSAIACFVASSRSLNFPGFSFLICQMPKSLQHQRLGVSEGREHYCWRVYVCAHTCALRIRTDLILHADSCMRGSMLSVMFYKMAGRVLLFFHFFSSFRIPL